jgi:trehalose 6-phosphate synthase
VNSINDGMNLVAKEGCIVNERGGVLVLSRGAGSYAELGEHALGVDPRDIFGTAAALHTALSMPGAERQRRAEALRETVLGHQLRDWLECQLEDLGFEARPRRAPSLPDMKSIEEFSATTSVAG